VIRRAAILVGVPVVGAALVAVPLSLWRGEYQGLCAAVAVGLVVPPGVLTLFVAERLGRSSLYGPLLALVVGTFGRVLFGFGGAAAVFLLSKPTFEADPISYFGWVLGVYLTTLLTETVLLARNRADRTSGPPEPPKV
jgi:hypothetical protein